jgi:predicted NUDIX family phosphoesterase
MSVGEQIMVIPRNVLQRYATLPQCGIKYLPVSRLATILTSSAIRFKDRAAMEQDPEYKQLIPYVVHVYNDAIFAYRRTPAGGESRLHGRRSIGIGGHINNGDGSVPGLRTYVTGLHRELREELQFDPTHVLDHTFVGLLNDDTDDVGSVHLALVHLVHMTAPEARLAKLADHADDGFHRIHQLTRHLDQFESWSQILLRSKLLRNL